MCTVQRPARAVLQQEIVGVSPLPKHWPLGATLCLILPAMLSSIVNATISSLEGRVPLADQHISMNFHMSFVTTF